MCYIPIMVPRMLRRFGSLDLEEKIINSAAFIAVIAVFCPWASGYLLGSDPVSYSGLGFYTSFIGASVLLINVYILALTVVPLTGGPIILKKRKKDNVRLACSAVSTILILSALSVLMRITFQFSRMEIRFGINTALIASMVVTFYAFLRVQEQKKSEVEEIFHNPARNDLSGRVDQIKEKVLTPAPLEPEEHRISRNI
ncbi:MAG: hypothetical protein QF755_03150 [Candidatus Peribacteraceae bacterium]|nr:hypothetical protein [Candidatus Peribacteraceae bacterium]